MNFRKYVGIALLIVAVVGLFSVAAAQDAPSGDLEIFSWWAGGGEAAGLEALIARFSEMYPGVNIINSAVSGGSGVNARAVLATRLQADDPPGTFQVHAGSALNDLWVAADKMESLNFIYEANGWLEQYPQGLLDLISADGEIYAVPVNIHRSNVMWYIPANLEEWGVTVPASWEEFLTDTCPTLQAAGVVPLSVGLTWTQMHLWESVALAELGPEAYAGLWTGDTAWDSEEVAGVFDTYSQVLACTNDDRDAIDWQPATLMVVEGEAAFNVMGDWAAGYLLELGLEPETGFGWVASPGTEGSFMMLSDAFGLPKGAPNRDAVVAWLTFLGSAEAQDIFNPLKGSLPANLTADLSNTELYNAYFQSAAADWSSNAIVGSLAHEAVGAGEFQNGFAELIAQLGAGCEPATAAAVAVELAAETLAE
ncbi:MAG: carbohydrate ABC transporter substrate-binding protein [Chloroflexi bacterium]|nr:carbohydrate ABC transporter substrate-binding protein [Chloroflexota bacterium]